MHVKRAEWENLNPEELELMKKKIFSHYRDSGFPYYNEPLLKQESNMVQMDDYFKSNEVIQGDIIKQTMHCLSTAWTYFPHAWDIKYNGKYTPIEIYNDDKLFMKAITKRLKRGRYVTDSGIRKELKSTPKTQAVSIFRPSASRAIYDKYGGSGVTWDPSAGFGGRLLGAISSPTIKKYIACEPSVDTFKGLSKMAETLNVGKEINLYNIGSEEFELKEKVDLVFTSLHYFNTEVYPEYREWLDGYLYKTLMQVPESIKKGGYLIINISKNTPNLVADFKQIMKNKKGMELVETLKRSSSWINKAGFKYEPIFVYKKL